MTRLFERIVLANLGDALKEHNVLVNFKNLREKIQRAWDKSPYDQKLIKVVEVNEKESLRYDQHGAEISNVTLNWYFRFTLSMYISTLIDKGFANFKNDLKKEYLVRLHALLSHLVTTG